MYLRVYESVVRVSVCVVCVRVCVYVCVEIIVDQVANLSKKAEHR